MDHRVFIVTVTVLGGNEYTGEILKGDSHAVLGWSGDAFQLTKQDKNIGYNQPADGFIVLTDSMQIPVGAPHAFTAEKMMDFVYDPEIQAGITEYLHYVPPVKGTKEALQARNSEVAGSPLVFPDLSRSHSFKLFPIEEEQQIDAAFQKAIGA